MEQRRVRSATTASADLRFLEEMLVEAFAWRPDAPRPTVAEVLANGNTAIYLEGWGRGGDEGFIAEGEGRLLGACW